MNRKVDALTKKNERKGRKHESRQRGSGGSAGPLYFRGFLGEIRSMDSKTPDSFWSLKETQSAVKPQYVPPMSAVEAPLEAPQIAPLIIETRQQVSAK